MHKILCLVLGFACPVSILGAAGVGPEVPPTPAPLTLQIVLDAVHAHDPNVAAAKADSDMAKGEALSAYAWSPPQLGVEWMGLDAVNPNLGSAMSRKYSLTQALPFPGRTWAAGRLASHQADTRADRARQVELDELEHARKAFFDLAAADYLNAALTYTAQVTHEMAQLSAHRGDFGQLDRMGQFMDTMLGLALADVDAMLPDARQQRLDAVERLKRLMGGSVEALGSAQVDVDALLAQPSVTLEEAERSAEAANPSLAAAVDARKAAQAARGLAWSGWLPDLMAEGYVTEDDLGGRQDGAMLGVSLPWLWGWGQAGKVAAADAGADQARLALEAEHLELDRAVCTAVGELDAAREALRIVWTRARPRAEQGLTQGLEGFRTTALGPSEILMALQDYRMTQQSVAQGLARFGQAQATLINLIGGPDTGTATQGDKP